MDNDKPTSAFNNIIDKSKGLFDDIRRNCGPKNLLKKDVCCYCGKNILGLHYIDLYGQKICASHPRHLCISCCSFCDDKAIMIAEGKYLCTNCQNYHTTLKDAKKIIKMIREHYLQTGLGVIDRFHLEMVSVEEMRQLCQPISAGDVLGLAMYNGRRYDIRVIRNLSHTAMAGILAHEILHIWQYQRKLNAPQRICEGFCDLGSYEIYKLIKTTHAEVKIDMLQKDPSPIYGDGYRIVKRYFDKAGWQGVIKKMEGYVNSNGS